MRYPACEKLEIIQLVEHSHLPVRRTLVKLGIPRATFYRWYDLYRTGGPDALGDRSGSRAASTTALSEPTGSQSLLVRKAPFPPISSHSRPHARCSSRSSKRSGALAREQRFAGARGPLFPVKKGIRLLGMTLSSLGEKQLESEPQLRLSI